MSVFAVSDLHGCYEQWKQIQDFCKENDRIFVLGDCIDRGPDGFDTLKSVLNDSRVVLLCGNHEDMMMQALEEERDFGYSDYSMWIWFNNGGHTTYDAWQEDGRDFSWIHTIKNLPTWATYVNQEGNTILMSHSGLVPKANWSLGDCTRKQLLWDRDHLKSKHWHRSDNEISLHGHTPIMIMPQFDGKDVEIEPGAMWYCDNHKCNIDNGGFWTGNICLLDLDTWDEHIFS